MQSSGIQTSLGCTECDTSFNSASLLLRHFAEHIIQKNHEEEYYNACQEKKRKSNGDVEYLHSKVEKEESILEKVLKSSLSCGGPSTEPVASGSREGVSFPKATVLVNKAKYSTALKNKLISSSFLPKDVCLAKLGAKVPRKAMLLGITKDSKNKCSTLSNVMFVKLDLQKRLENCVLKLVKNESSFKGVPERENGAVTKSNETSISGESNVLEEVTGNSLYDSETGFFVNEVQERGGNGDTADSEFTPTEPDEFNPLKFCVVTLEEGEGSLEFNDTETKDMKKLNSPSIFLSEKNNHFLFQNGTFSNLMENTSGKNSHKTVQKKYVCTYCCRRFGWSTDLKRHILTHTGERPFKCKLCRATFTRNFLLQKHQFKIHSENVPNNNPDNNVKIKSETSIKEELPEERNSVLNFPVVHVPNNNPDNNVKIKSEKFIKEELPEERNPVLNLPVVPEDEKLTSGTELVYTKETSDDPKKDSSVIRVHTESSDSEIGELEICDKKPNVRKNNKSKKDHYLVKRRKFLQGMKPKKLLTNLHKQTLSNGILSHAVS